MSNLRLQRSRFRCTVPRRYPKLYIWGSRCLTSRQETSTFLESLRGSLANVFYLQVMQLFIEPLQNTKRGFLDAETLILSLMLVSHLISLYSTEKLRLLIAVFAILRKCNFTKHFQIMKEQFLSALTDTSQRQPCNNMNSTPSSNSEGVHHPKLRLHLNV